MTPKSPIDGKITSTEDFDAAFGQLVETAVRNGIDVEGSWIYRNGESFPDLEAVIVELAKEVADT